MDTLAEDYKTCLACRGVPDETLLILEALSRYSKRSPW